jgi:hypothetical protein
MPKDSRSYAEKLKDPRWQKKRLEVLNEADWECSNCGQKEETLHVHHPAYQKGKQPWDYATEDLFCLCEKCHKSFHEQERLFDELVAEIKTDINMRQNIMFYLGWLTLASLPGPFDVKLIDYEFARGAGEYLGANAEWLIKHSSKEGILSGDLIEEIHKMHRANRDG